MYCGHDQLPNCVHNTHGKSGRNLQSESRNWTMLLWLFLWTHRSAETADTTQISRDAGAGIIDRRSFAAANNQNMAHGKVIFANIVRRNIYLSTDSYFDYIAVLENCLFRRFEPSGFEKQLNQYEANPFLEADGMCRSCERWYQTQNYGMYWF